MQTGILAVAFRELKRMAFSKICIWGIIVVPMLSAAILMYMMDSGLPQKIPIAVVDQDNTSTTRALVRQLDAFAKTDIKFKSLSFRQARLAMERNDVYAVLSIPKDFTRDAISGQQPKLVFYTDNAFFVSGNLLFQDLRTISTLASASVGLKTALAKGISERQVMPILQPITVDSHVLGNPWVNYSICLNNSLLPSILQLVILIFTISAFGSEVKSRLGGELMKLGNDNIVTVIIGKLLPYTFLYLLISLTFMALLYGFRNFPMKTGFFPMFFNYVCLIFGAQGLGLVLVGVFQNYRMALSIGSLIGMLSFSITGFSFPVEAMHSSLQALSYMFPMRHFFLIYVSQALNGYPIGYAAYHFAALLGFLLVGFLFFRRIRNFLGFDYEE
jgi:ABC-2 type transport system permease protein